MDVLVFFINKVIISGTVLGSIYALGAIGVTLIFGILRFAHFAHGDMMTMGAFFAFLLALIFYHYGIVLPIPAGFVVLPVAMIITAIVALAIDKTIYAPLRKRGPSREGMPSSERTITSVAHPTLRHPRARPTAVRFKFVDMAHDIDSTCVQTFRGVVDTSRRSMSCGIRIAFSTRYRSIFPGRCSIGL